MTAADPTASPLSLAQVQTAMASHILQGHHPDAAALVRPHGALTVEQRLQIYHQAYRLRLLEVLQDHYAQTLVYLGDEFFESQALASAAEDADEHTAMQWLQHWMAEQLLADYRTA